jgi:thiamine-monophosphate kinase
MDRERDLIRIFMDNLGGPNPGHIFESDAQTFRIRDDSFLFTTDEFSCEDNFRSHNPASLGWNLAAATISDIYAAGGTPLFYGHSVTVQQDWDAGYIDRFSKGIASCLEEAGASFLGGDLGIGDKWKYTGIAIGHGEVPISRFGARAGDLIYSTGTIGSGNLEAALMLYSENKVLRPFLGMIDVRFPLRSKEASLIRKFASCCIDSSDGLMRALLDLTGLSGTGFRIDHIPYHRQGKMACHALGKPEEILFLGECGEYELVFTVSPEKETPFLQEAMAGNLSFNRLGAVTGELELIYHHGDRMLNLTGYSLFARNFKDVHQYIGEVISFIRNGYS